MWEEAKVSRERFFFLKGYSGENVGIGSKSKDKYTEPILNNWKVPVK